MRIAIDARAFAWTGIGRYIRNLLAGLAQVSTTHQYLVLLGENDVAAFSKLKTEKLNDQFSYQVVEKTYYSFKEQTTLLWQLLNVNADLFHFTHFNRPLLFRRPSVVTIHDTTRFIFPGERRQNWLHQVAYEYVFAQAVKTAREVICVSNSTKQELEALPLSLSKPATVIYEGVEAPYYQAPSVLARQKVRMLLGTNDPYLLFVGVWMSHKNLPRLLEAYAEVLRQRPQLKLVLTGKPKPGYDNILALARTLKIEQHVIFAGFVPEGLLPALYSEAACFVFPSLYEGFGLPPLEAAACGTPVISSNVSSMPEILGNAAYYINPEYVPGMVAAIHEVLGNAVLRQKLIEAGKKQAVKFRWENAAREHVKVYEAATKVKSLK